MTWILLTILLLIVAGVAAIVAKGAGKGEDARTWGWLTAGVALVLWLIISLVMSAVQIPAGHEGVEYEFGKITATVPAGFHLVPPWVSVTNANTQVQSHTFENLTAFSKETQDVNVTATINYSVDPKDVKHLYTTVGSGWFDKLVGTRVNQFFKDETVKFTATNIAPNRDQIRKDVRQRLADALAPYSVNVEDLLIDNITFSHAFTQAIEDKQIATQQAQAAQNRVATARFQAQQLIAQAQGQAKAQRLRRETLTPLLVEQNAIDKLNPNVQVIMVPANANFLLPNLLDQTATAGPTK